MLPDVYRHIYKMINVTNCEEMKFTHCDLTRDKLTSFKMDCINNQKAVSSHIFDGKSFATVTLSCNDKYMTDSY